MNIDLADITLHIDEELSTAEKDQLEQAFRQRDGIVSVHFNPNNFHLLILKYDPKRIHSRDIIDIPRYHGFHAELVGM